MKRVQSAHTSCMQTSTANRNRGRALSATFFAAAIAVGIIRWVTGNIATDGSFLLIMVFAAASVATYLKVAGVHTARAQRAEEQQSGHTAIVTPITAAGRHDAA
jgi:membrane protein implicated in regulation of membrane protease activity